MGRYVVASRIPGGRHAANTERWLSSLGREWTPRALRITRGRRTRALASVEIDDESAARAEVPDWIIFEREILHEIAAPAYKLRILGGAGPLSGALVLAQLRNASGHTEEEFAEANADGEVQLLRDPSRWQLVQIEIKPRHSYWTRKITDPPPRSAITLEPLPAGPLGWWHRQVGLSRHDATRGRGIRVGVMDTGCGPNRCLQHVINGGSVLHLAHDPDDGLDTDGHGTHVCGLIGARPDSEDQYPGIAPGADLISIRVVDAENRCSQDDMAAALDILVADHQIDLVNMSLVSQIRSEVLAQAILDIREAGSLAICAAGNSAGAVMFPAALAEAIGVSAVGLDDWGAPESFGLSERPPVEATERFGRDGLHFAKFSCHGPEVDCTAPGVGIVSTVAIVSGSPVFAEMDGTSMSSPIACAVLATHLANEQQYLAEPREEVRALSAEQVLWACCQDVGLPPELQGRGLPIV